MDNAPTPGESEPETLVRTGKAHASGSPWFTALYDVFAPARREAAAQGHTEEEINGWIDDAMRSVPDERAAKEARINEHSGNSTPGSRSRAPL